MMILARFAAGVGWARPACYRRIYQRSDAGEHAGSTVEFAADHDHSGLTGAFFANYFLAYSAGKSTDPLWLGFPAWRWMFWMQIFPASVFFLTLLFIPESPRYLVARGRYEEAKAVLTRLFGAATAASKSMEIRGSLAATILRAERFDR